MTGLISRPCHISGWHFSGPRKDIKGGSVASANFSCKSTAIPWPSKLVAQWPVPTSAEKVQQFLGLANYYRRFIKDFASKAKPLRQLTVKKLSFIWTADSQKSFDNLKQCLTTAPILAMPNWSKPFIIDTDACDSGIGEILSQIDENGMEHVVCYASRILTKAETNHCVT